MNDLSSRRILSVPSQSMFLGVIFLFLLIGGPGTFPGTAETLEAWISEVVDGDTVRLSDGKSVRYLGMDAPEVYKKVNQTWIYDPEPFAEEATLLNQRLVGGKKVLLEFEPKEREDRYGRLLAYVFVGDTFVNEKILQSGLAKIYKRSSHTKYRQLLRLAEKEAMKDRRGIWSKEQAPWGLREKDEKASGWLIQRERGVWGHRRMEWR